MSDIFIRSIWLNNCFTHDLNYRMPNQIIDLLLFAMDLTIACCHHKAPHEVHDLLAISLVWLYVLICGALAHLEQLLKHCC